MIKVACVLLTLNEEERIKKTLAQFRPHVEHILVVDSDSKDDTVKIAAVIADNVIVRKFSGSFAEEKNYARRQVPIDHGWILWADADEIWDKGFLETMKFWIDQLGGPGVIRFPRLNLPDGKDYPDYQVRIFPNSRDIEWRGETHEVPWLKTENIPLDQVNRPEYQKIRFGNKTGIPIFTADDYPIIHLPRAGERRPWW